jgi:Glycosyl transferase 4-like domain
MRIIEARDVNVISSLKSMMSRSRSKTVDRKSDYASYYMDTMSLKGKIIQLLRDAINYPDPQRGWLSRAERVACQVLDKEDVDVIISSSSPVTAHLIARRLKLKYDVPWIADFRDLWTQNRCYGKVDVIKLIEQRLELRTLTEADAMVTVSEPLRDALKAFHKHNRVLSVTNAYDEDDYREESLKLTDSFSITYTGSLESGRRDPALLFEAVTQLINEGRIKKDLVEIRFFGPREPWLIEEIQKFGIEGIVRLHGSVPREMVIPRQQTSQLLLLLLWNNRKDEGVYTGKIFEYLGARRPVLAIGWDKGVLADLMRETDSGVSVSDIDTLKKVLLTYYEEFRKYGKVIYRGNEKVVNYSYRNITGQYAAILDEVSSGRRGED